MLLNSGEKREFEHDYFVNKLNNVELAEKYKTSTASVRRYLQRNYGQGRVMFSTEQIVYILKSQLNECELSVILNKPESVIKRILDAKA